MTTGELPVQVCQSKSASLPVCLVHLRCTMRDAKHVQCRVFASDGPSMFSSGSDMVVHPAYLDDRVRPTMSFASLLYIRNVVDCAGAPWGIFGDEAGAARVAGERMGMRDRSRRIVGRNPSIFILPWLVWAPCPAQMPVAGADANTTTYTNTSTSIRQQRSIQVVHAAAHHRRRRRAMPLAAVGGA
jgi:hypothetical protein